MDKSLAKKHKTPTMVLVRRILRDYVRPHSKSVALATFFMLLSAGLTASFAVMIEPVIDDVLSAGNLGRVRLLEARFLPSSFCAVFRHTNTRSS